MRDKNSDIMQDENMSILGWMVLVFGSIVAFEIGFLIYSALSV